MWGQYAALDHPLEMKPPVPQLPSTLMTVAQSWEPIPALPMTEGADLSKACLLSRAVSLHPVTGNCRVGGPDFFPSFKTTLMNYLDQKTQYLAPALGQFCW